MAWYEAHQKGVIHRDLKPDNIMINSRRQPVVMDFGLAQRMGAGDPRITRTNSFVGTPAYMSPEQISDSGSAGPASDIFSLGIITYELLVGARPFEGEDVMSIIGAILTKEPASPKKWSVQLDPEIQAICLRSLEKKVKNRYASMQEFADALGEYLTENRGPSIDIPAQVETNPSPGEETLVQEMLKGISVSSASRTVTGRSTKKRRSNKIRWIAVAFLGALVLLIPRLAMRDWSSSTPRTSSTTKASSALEPGAPLNGRSEPDSKLARINPNRSLLAPSTDVGPDGAKSVFAMPAGGGDPNDLNGLDGEREDDVTQQTAEPETPLQGPSATLPATLRRGLVAHFPLDESEGREAANAVPRQPGGVYVGPGQPTWVSGVIGNAAHLRDGYFDCGKNINPSQYNAFSFGCWYYSDGSQFAALIAKTDETNSYRGFELYLHRADPRQPNNPLPERLSIHLLHQGGSGIARSVDIGSLESGWHHAFATYDGSSKAQGARLYLDGRMVGVVEADSLSGTLQNNVSLLIGRRSIRDQYRGRIDDVRIYNRSLRPQEVEQLYLYGVRSVENVPVDERTADQTDLLRRLKRAKENAVDR